MRDIIKERVMVLFFLFFSFFLYSNSLNAPFYFDDKHMIENNLFIKNIKYIPWLFKGYVTSYTIAKGMCRPLLMLTFSLNYFGGGLNPLGYHILNVLLHFLNGLFLYFLLIFFLPAGTSYEDLDRKNKEKIPLFLAALITIFFLSHPINTEAITYISSRSDLLVTLSIGFSFLFYLKKRYLLSLICYTVSLLSKETALCLPLLLCAYEFIFSMPDLNIKNVSILLLLKNIKNKKIYYYLMLVLITIGYFIYNDIVFKGQPSTPLRSYYSNILIQSAVTFFYLKLFVFPHQLNLHHYFPELNTILTPLPFISLIGVISLVMLIFFLRKKYPLISFGIAWYVICLLPKFYARLNYVACEHHFYLPSIGIYIILFVISQSIYLRYRKYFIYVSIGIISIFTILTLFRNYEYNDKFIMWKLSAKRDSLSAPAHNELGIEYMKKGDLKSAEEAFKKTISLSNRFPTTINSKANLAGIYRINHEYEKAIELLKELTLIKPVPPKVYENLGIIYSEMGKDEEALRSWKKELEIYPQSPGTYVMLGFYHLTKKNIDKASKLFNLALELEPDSYLIYYGLGRIAEIENKFDKAVYFYNKSLYHNQYFFDAHYSLAGVYVKQGDYRAIDEFKVVIKLKQDFKGAYNDLALLYASIIPPDWELADEYAQKAIQLGYPVKEDLLKLIENNLSQ